MMNTSGHLNRSCSESELHKFNFENLRVGKGNPNPHFKPNIPVVRKTVLVVEEICHGFPSLFRSESIPTQLHKIENRNFMLNSFLNVNTLEISSYCDKHDGITPMDIDLLDISKTGHSLDAIEKMDINLENHESTKETLNISGTGLKKRQINKQSIILSKKSQKNNISTFSDKKQTSWSKYLIVFFIFLVIIIYFCCFQSIIFVNSQIQLQNIRKDLLENIYEQKGPVNIVIRSLENRERWKNKIKILCFIGSTGVGKTFIANILKRNFHQDLIHELYDIYRDVNNEWKILLSNLNSCCLNLIIVDNLNKKDIEVLFNLMHFFPKDYYILVITIFSIQYSDDELNYFINYDDINEIRHEFDSSDLFHELAVFHQFDEHHVKDWLERQLKVQNVTYSEKLYDVLHNHNVLYEGLKGLYTKLLLVIDQMK